MIFKSGLQGSKMLELPPLSLYSMTKPQLQEFIPRLINLSTSTSEASSFLPPDTSFYKPVWWPSNIPWIDPSVQDCENLCKEFTADSVESTDELRSVVMACYEYMGHKELLTNSSTSLEDNLSSLKANTDIMAVDSSEDDSEPEVVDVYVCFYCDHWFGGTDGKRKLEEHVLTHMNTDSMTPYHTVSERSVTRPTCSMAKPSALKRGQESKPFLPRPPRKRVEIPLSKRKDLPCDNGVSESDFLKSFGLISSQQAKKDAKKSKPDMDIDCEIVAVEGLESKPMTSPRTPKSLMSQLSRDGEGSSRKRLSFCVAEDGSDGENAEPSPSKNIQGALLNVPFSSLLGKRVKKHIKPDSSVCTIKEPEEYCSTVKFRNEFVDKLRFRPTDYPVTYRRKRKHCSKFTHEYKFNREQKVEFLKRVRTGLNKESRCLKRQMMKCKVVLKRLSKEEIDFWKERKKSRSAEWIDDDISIVHIEPPPTVDRSRLYAAGTSGIVRQMKPNPMQTAGSSHNPSMMLQSRSPYLMAQLAAAQRSQVAQKSVPQFLVKKVEKQFNGHQSSKLVYVPISELQTGPQKRIESRPKPYLGSQGAQTSKMWGKHTMVVDRRVLVQNNSRRKQHFVNVRKEMDDSDVSIHSESSDEEKMKTSAGNQHMVMSATGEFVKTVGQKARKSFGRTTAMVNAQTLRHFTSHPIPKSGSQWQIRPKTETLSKNVSSSMGNITVKPVCHPESAKLKNSMSSGISPRAACVASAALVRPTTNVLPKQPPLRVVDDVIYIDDDD